MRTAQRKGQSAMEYLMTYGWAILIVIIVAAVLFSLGVFNPATYSTTASTGFPGFNIPVGGYQMSNAGVLTLQMSNAMGSTISITKGGAIIGTNRAADIASPTPPITVAPGQSVTLTFNTGATLTTGNSYSVNANVTYDNSDTGLTGFISSGTLSGTVS